MAKDKAPQSEMEGCRNTKTGVEMCCRTWAKAMLVGALLYGGIAASAQSSAPATPAPYNPIALAAITGAPRAEVQADQGNIRFESQSPYLGGIPSGKPRATPIPLSLEDAIALGLKHNLGGVLASDAVTDARGQRWQDLSELLPNVVTDSGFGVHQIKLKAAIGLSIPGVPPVVGPFGYFDSRAYFTQSVFDWESIERTRSSTAQLKSAEFGSQNARELVVLVIVSNYLLAIADQSEVESATSQRDTAKALFQQASDQETAGVASAVDVLRSEVELKSREQAVISAQNDLAKEKLVLARAIGLPLGQRFEITTSVPYHELTTSSLDEAIERAYRARPDFQSQMNRIRAAELRRKAASAERYPSIGAETDYGLSGVNPGRRTALLMQPSRSGSLSFREGEYTGMFSEPTPRWRGKDNGWKTCGPGSIRRSVTPISISKPPRRKYLSRKVRWRLPRGPWNNLAIDLVRV